MLCDVRANGASFIINLDTNKLTVTITSASGLFSGSIGVPGSGKTVAFTGVVLQKQNIGSGFFLGTNQSGRVLLSP